MKTAQRWEQLYNQTPLCDVPRHYAALNHSPFLLDYLKQVLELCPRGGRTCEIGIGSGYGAIWLSLRGVQAEGIDYAPGIVERARQVNNILDGRAQFHSGDMFEFFCDRYGSTTPAGVSEPQFQVIHHQGVLEHLSVPWIQAALAQQVAAAEHVVFSVPSIHYPFDPEFGNERLLLLEEWERILAPFDIIELKYYGDPRLGEREHAMAVLRGQPVDEQLLSLMQVPKEPYMPGISAIVHTRNEARHIVDCLSTLKDWTDEVIVCDMESTDATVELARPLADHIMTHPQIANFDRARNASAMRARHRWVFYLDADERVPPELGATLRQLAFADETGFEGLLIPFRHHFAGHWMQCLYPGYTAPRFLKNGRFHFNPRLHSGVEVDGRTICFPADNPGLALTHYSFDSLSHYLDKLNRYTDGEAANMHQDGQPFHWKNAVGHFVGDFQSYYDRGQAKQDGVHGFLYAFLSGFYRFEQHAKLYERRLQTNQLQPGEQEIPASLEQMLEYALAVVRQKPLEPAPAIHLADSVENEGSFVDSHGIEHSDVGTADIVAESHPDGTSTEPLEATRKDGSIASPLQAHEAAGVTSENLPPAAPKVVQEQAAEVVWSGPLHDPSGYGEESRHFLWALDEVGIRVAAQPLPWSHQRVELPENRQKQLDALMERPVKPGFLQIVQNFPPSFQRHPQAGCVIGRTMFETDRLPADWVKACNQMDYIWVPTEFNRQTFRDAGVDPQKLVVIPGCFDAAPFLTSTLQDEGQQADTSLSSVDISDDAYRLNTDFARNLNPTKDTIFASEDNAPEIESICLRRLLGSKDQARFTFLTVFDWTLHKGWDVLLSSFIEAFRGRDDVTLLLKVWSTMGYDADSIKAQAADYVARTLGHDLLGDGRIHFLTERLTSSELQALYCAVDAYVMPSRGEGWGRPYMEAMAHGLPTIGINWSGNTAFMNSGNSFLVDCEVQPVPEIGWREIPTYRGHRWAEPDQAHLVQQLRFVAENSAKVREIAQRGQQDVLDRYNHRAVGHLMEQEIGRLQVQQIASKKRYLSSALRAADDPTGDIRSDGSRNRHADGMADGVDAPSLSKDHSSIRVRWEGAQFEWHSLAHVNREFCLNLLDAGNVELSLVPPTPAHFNPAEDPRFNRLAGLLFEPILAPADVHVRHFFPPRFQTPEEGKFVLIQPWEYGYLPAAWVEPIRQKVDEVWCYSEYVRQVYLDSGIPADKLQVVPLGVDIETFKPEAPPYIFTIEAGADVLQTHQSRDNQAGRGLPTTPATSSSRLPNASLLSEGEERRFIFLFVGGTLHRKGIDILLDAYLKAFSACDNVCLVIKDTGTQTVYRGQNDREKILGLIGDPTRPPLVYLEEDLSAHQLAGLYTAADCLVQPYRGEGFCLPALEAMACGLPVVVPDGGPTNDFIDETVGWRLPAERKPFAVGPSGVGMIGDWSCTGPTWMFEIDPNDLARALRSLYINQDEVKKRGTAASARVQKQWSWKHAAAIAQQRLHYLAERNSTASVPVNSGLFRQPDLNSGTVLPSENGVMGEIEGDDSANQIAPSQDVESAPAELPLPPLDAEPIDDAEAPIHSTLQFLNSAQGTPLQDTLATFEEAGQQGAAHKGSLRSRHEIAMEATRLISNSPLQHGGTPKNGGVRQNGGRTSTNIGTSDSQKQVSQRKPTISLCMIVRNEERVLGQCLESVRPWVDEIIMVDTGSDDRTVEIARAYGCRLFNFPWCDDFSAARNESLRHATGDWLFWMDADDTIPAECGRQLHELVALAEDRTTGFLMQVHIPPAPGEHGFTIVDHVKLFRNLPELRFEGRIHEQILEPIYRIDGRVERSNLYVVHSGYDYSVEGQQRKRERDFTLLNKDLQERPNHPFVLFNIGMTAYHLKDYDQARPALERCLSLSKPQESTVRKVYAMLAGCHLEQNRLPEAQETIEKGLKLFPHDPELLFRAGIIYRETGDLKTAEECYLKLLTNRETGHIDSLDVSMTGYKAHHNLALIYLDQQKIDNAEAAMKAAVADNPQFVPSWLGLGEIYLMTGRWWEAQDVANRVAEFSPQEAQKLLMRLQQMTHQIASHAAP